MSINIQTFDTIEDFENGDEEHESIWFCDDCSAEANAKMDEINEVGEWWFVMWEIPDSESPVDVLCPGCDRTVALGER